MRPSGSRSAPQGSRSGLGSMVRSRVDRIIALECITYNISGAVVLVSLGMRTSAFMDFLLVVALLGFLGTVVLTAYVEKTLGA